jgi:hypothetical protein
MQASVMLTRSSRLGWIVSAVVVGLLSRSAVAEDRVGVLVTGPLVATVGEKLSFEVELVNRSGQPLSQLRIIDYFDGGLRHEASKSPIEQKGTVDLAAGTSRRMTLEFIAAEPGRQCHRVEILDPSQQFVGGATACVEVTAPAVSTAAASPPAAALPSTPARAEIPRPFAPTSPPTPPTTTQPPAVAAPSVALPAAPPSARESGVPDLLPPASSVFPRGPAAAAAPATLEMEITGPTERKPGTVAEFIATVRNTGQTASTGGTLEISWDRGFAALEASDGYVMGSDKVSWSLPDVEPGATLRRQINLRLPATASETFGFRAAQPRLCVRGVLSGVAGGVLVADECCVGMLVEQTRRQAVADTGLRLSLADCDDPIRVGSSTTLVCTIHNDGSQPSGMLGVVITIPEQARLVGDPSPSRVRIDGRNVAFDGIPPIAPGAITTLELAFRLPVGGRWRSEATLNGDLFEGSLTATCETTALAP